MDSGMIEGGGHRARQGSQRRMRGRNGSETGEQARLERLNRRRLRNIDPMRAGKVLGHERYWTFPFLRLYLDACDERAFHGGELGYQMAQHAPELARRVPVLGADPGSDRPRSPLEAFGTELEKIEWRVRALAVWGSCCRASGELTEALAAYERAQELCRAHAEVGPDARGEVLARRAVLYIACNELEAAVEAASEAIGLFSRASNRQRMADAYVIRGASFCRLRDPRVLDDSIAALEQLDRLDAQSERTFASALQNVSMALAVGGTRPESQQLAARLIGQVRVSLARRPMSPIKMRVFWVEGLVLMRLALSRIAEKRLAQARDGLWQLGELHDYFVVSLDLACLFLLEGEQVRARELLDETVRNLEGRRADPLLLDLVKGWQGNLTAAQLDSIRGALGTSCGRNSSRLP